MQQQLKVCRETVTSLCTFITMIRHCTTVFKKNIITWVWDFKSL